MKTITTVLLAFLMVSLVNAQIPADGLVAWYPFNGNANDESGNGNNGTVFGVSLTIDRFGNQNSAYYFDGNSRIEVQADSSIQPVSGFTLCAWVKPQDQSSWHSVINKRNSNISPVYNSYGILSSGQIPNHWLLGFGNTSNEDFVLQSADPINPNSWCFITGTYDGVLLKIYIDNVLNYYAPSSGDIIYSDLPLYIGCSAPIPGQYMLGDIDDIRIYNRALTQEEITSLYHESPCPGLTGSSISGSLSYDNQSNTPLSCSNVFLKSSGGNLIDSTETDLEGNYQFCGVPDGSYTLSASTTKIPGGINSGDALQALRHFTEYINFTGLRFKAADVNGNGYVNSTDALLIGKRYIEYITTFPIGNWVFEEPLLTITGSSAQVVDFKGICVGDVNGSYDPPGCMNAPCPGLSSFSYGGQTYHTVQIGNQCWMKENLNIGTMVFSVPGGIHSDVSDNGIIEKYCYNNDSIMCIIYGGLYDWDEMMNYAATSGIQGICPTGWHLPGDSELCSLTTYLDITINCNTYGWSGNNAGGKMKEVGLTHWNPNSGATNESGFSTLGAGYRMFNGNFYNLNEYSYISSSSEYSSSTCLYRAISSSGSNMYRYDFSKTAGFSVRCLKNTP